MSRRKKSRGTGARAQAGPARRAAAGAGAGAGPGAGPGEGVDATGELGAPRLPIWRVLVVALCAAVWAGLVEEIPAFIAPYGGIMVRLGRQFVWMTPAGDVLFFGVVALLLLGLGTLWPRLRRRDVVVGVFTAMFVLAIGLLLERLYAWAVLLLAIGVGSEVARRTRGPARRPQRLIVSTLVGILIVVGLAGRRAWNDHAYEAREMAALPAARKGSPNIVLLILDTVRAASLDILNGPGVVFDSPGVHAPVLDSLAAHGALFTDAIAPAPWTLPSHASMFTGRWTTRLGANWDRALGDRYPTIAGVLSRHGYATAGFVGNLLYTARETGLARGFIHYDDYPVSLGQVVLSCAIGRRLAANDLLRRLTGTRQLLNRKSARTVTDEFLSWQAHEQAHPFFVFLNFFDAHEPYFPPDSVLRTLPPGAGAGRYDHYVGLLKGASARRDKKWTMTLPQRKAFAAGYDAAILRMDGAVGHMLAVLGRRGVLKNTVVIIVGDHGEQLGEHGLYEHENSLYMTTLHVPLIMAGPGVPAGTRIRRVASLRDMSATLLSFAGLAPGTGGIPAGSLTRDWGTATGPVAGPAPDSMALAFLVKGYSNQPWYPSAWGPAMFSLVDSTYEYIRNGDGTEALYDLKTDPAELKDIHAERSLLPVLTHFRLALDSLAPRLPQRQPTGHPGPPKPGGATAGKVHD